MEDLETGSDRTEVRMRPGNPRCGLGDREGRQHLGRTDTLGTPRTPLRSEESSGCSSCVRHLRGGRCCSLFVTLQVTANQPPLSPTPSSRTFSLTASSPGLPRSHQTCGDMTPPPAASCSDNEFAAQRRHRHPGGGGWGVSLGFVSLDGLKAACSHLDQESPEI